MSEKLTLNILCLATGAFLLVAAASGVLGYVGLAVSSIAAALGSGLAVLLQYMRAINRAAQDERYAQARMLETLSKDVEGQKENLRKGQDATDTLLSSLHELLSDAVRRIKLGARAADRSQQAISELVIARSAAALMALQAAKQDLFEEIKQDLRDLQSALRTQHNAIVRRVDARHHSLHVQGEMLPGEVVALQRLSGEIVSPLADLPSIGGWALTAPTLISVVSEILRSERRRNLLECGSGASTVWMAFALRHRGEGHIYALEHESKFAEATRRWLCKNGLEKWATILEAPLLEYELGGDTYRWYDISNLPADFKIDLLLVDGPPAATGPHARYPALPLLKERLNHDAWVVLDDIVRPDERDIQASWMDEAWNGLKLVHEMDLPKSVVLKVEAEAADKP